MMEVCAQLKISHHNSVTYRPIMNGVVEAANKYIKKIVAKMVETYKDWHEKLPFALLAYRTSVRTFIGTKAILLIKVKIPLLWVLM